MDDTESIDMCYSINSYINIPGILIIGENLHFYKNTF